MSVNILKKYFFFPVRTNPQTPQRLVLFSLLLVIQKLFFFGKIGIHFSVDEACFGRGIKRRKAHMAIHQYEHVACNDPLVQAMGLEFACLLPKSHVQDFFTEVHAPFPSC